MSSQRPKKNSGKGGKKRQNRTAENQSSPAANKPKKADLSQRPPETPFAFFQQEKKPDAPVEKLFHKVDWIAFGITTFVVMLGYYLTLAPDLTLEDSGELAVGSMYAGIPHPPGYPVWTLYTWLFTELVPFYNIAWRVALSSAVAGAFSCGIIAMMVSRGTRSMFGLFDSLREMPESSAKSISVVCGYVAGMLMGFNGFMWSQAVIVEVYTLSVLTLVLQMVCLMRWMHSPFQHRWLYLAWFWAGICFTNHQTLLVAVVGMEIAILARDRSLGRDRFILDALAFFLGLAYKTISGGTAGALDNQLMWNAFVCIGLFCVVVAIVMIVISRGIGTRIIPSILCFPAFFAGASFYFYMPLAGMTNPPMQWGYPRTIEGFKHALTRGQYEKANPTSGLDRFVEQIGTYIDGTVEEFNLIYLLVCLIPIAVIFYRRLSENQKIGLAIGSGLYAFVGLIVLIKAKGTGNLDSLLAGLACGYLFLLVGLIPFLFYKENRAHPIRAWLCGTGAMYLFLSLLLLFLLNPQPDRQSQQLNRVFFTASYVPISMFIGYGLALMVGGLAVAYDRFKAYARVFGVFSILVAAFALFVLEDNYWVAEFNAWYGLILAMAFVAVLFVGSQRVALRPLLAVLCLMPIYTFSTHWAGNEQRGHLFGYWFGHDMFTPPFEDKEGKPLYPEMAKDAVLYGGTDPGRFCPTYMIFCESFIPPHKRLDPDFDRRDVYIITQNALADGTYLMYIRAHYNRSAQIDPPFFQELFRKNEERMNGVTTNGFAKLFSPLDSLFGGIGDSIEKKRRAGSSFFTAEHFTDVNSLAAKISAGKDGLAKHLISDFDDDTKELLSSGDNERKLKKALVRELNEVLEAGALYESNRFAHVKLTDRTKRFIKEDPQSHTRIRLNRILLEEAYGDEIVTSLGGVYPDMEMYISSPDDSQVAFQTYIADAQRRLEHDMKNPKAPKQIKPGEHVNYDPASGRVSVSGQVAVMAINGLLTKNMFDKNPHLDFYVEESFPLDWMYPHLTPYGIIMKIEREPLDELTQEMVDRDHEFWSQYSGRLIGNWITYDTPVKEICDFIDRVYLKRDFTGFTGDTKFIRDDNGKKAFSKLRSAIAGVYFWRINQAGGLGRVEAQQRMIREADFAFRQAFAYCPFSPEAVFRYTNLLISLRRIDDALLIAHTFLKFDPNNGAVKGLLAQLQNMKKAAPAAPAQAVLPQGAANQVSQLAQMFQTNPSNVAVGFQLFNIYMSAKDTNQAAAVLDKLVAQPNADTRTLTAGVQGYAQLGQPAKRQSILGRLVQSALKDVADPKADVQRLQMAANAFNITGQMAPLEQAMSRLAKLLPTSAETWYDLAGVQAVLRKNPTAVASLSNAVRLSDARLKATPAAANLRKMVTTDNRFKVLEGQPGFAELK